MGLLSSKQQFTELKYLISPEFRLGLAGLSHHRKRLAFGLLILTSTLISLFAGPSAALLLIPTQQSDWPAGGASFSLAGDENSLWPSKLTVESIEESRCKNAGMQALDTEALNLSGCIWSGYSTFAETYKRMHFNGETELIIDDGVLKRAFVTRGRGEVAETWALGSHMAVGLFSKNLAFHWYQALLEIPSSSWRYTLRYRVYNQTIAYTKAWAPAVRTRCNVYTEVFANGSGLQFTVCSFLKSIFVPRTRAKFGQVSRSARV